VGDVLDAAPAGATFGRVDDIDDPSRPFQQFSMLHNPAGLMDGGALHKIVDDFFGQVRTTRLQMNNRADAIIIDHAPILQAWIAVEAKGKIGVGIEEITLVANWANAPSIVAGIGKRRRGTRWPRCEMTAGLFGIFGSQFKMPSAPMSANTSNTVRPYFSMRGCGGFFFAVLGAIGRGEDLTIGGAGSKIMISD
jgi:hypothetical protein